MALDPNIALGVRGVEVPNPLAQYAQVAQIQSMQNQNQVSQMQLDQMRRDDETFKQIQAKAVEHGGPADIRKIADAYLNSGNPKFIQFGIDIDQKLKDRENIARIMSMGQTPTAAPAAPAINALAPTMQAGTLGSGTFGMAPEPRVNQLAPAAAPAPAANALAAPSGPDISLLRAKRDAFIAMNRPDLARSIDADIALASKVNTAAPGSAILDSAGRVIGNIPEATPADVRTMQMLGYPNTQAGYAAFYNDKRQDRILTPEEEAQRIRVALASRPPRPEAAPRTQQVTMSDGTLGIMNMDTGAVTPSTLGGVPVKGKDASKTAVSEQQASYNLGRVLTAASQINEIGKKDPDAVKPGGAEALAASIGMGGTANLARNANRQIVFGAQRDALDALLYLATGAAYNKEQLEGQMAAYIPSFTDKPENVAAKKARMTDLIKSAKTRAGKAWTPEMDAAMNTLTVPMAEPAPAPGASQGTGGFKYLGKESTK
jgi:hypothetical protein